MLKIGAPEADWIGPIASDDPDDARPFLLAGVRTRFRRIGIRLVRAARRAVAEALKIDEGDVEEAGDAFTRAMILGGLMEWEGVGNLDGEVIPVTPENIEAFMADPHAFEAAESHYVMPWVARDIVGKELPPLLAGTGAAATGASGIVRSPAKRKPRAAAKRARTKRTT